MFHDDDRVRVDFVPRNVFFSLSDPEYCTRAVFTFSVSAKKESPFPSFNFSYILSLFPEKIINRERQGEWNTLTCHQRAKLPFF